MKTWKLAVLVGAATAAAVGGAAVALVGGDGERDRTAPASVAQAAPGECPNGDGGQYGAPDGEGRSGDPGGQGRYGAPDDGPNAMGEAMQGLLQDPESRAALEQLRDEARAAMDDWRDRYGDDPTSDAARKALEKVWKNQRSAMEKLAKKYGLEWDDLVPGHGSGHGAGDDESAASATETAATF